MKIDPDFKRREEQRRERHWDPAMKWKVIQETITWAEAQSSFHKNSIRARLKEQAAKLAAQKEN